jgi:hypothetical protein
MRRRDGVLIPILVLGHGFEELLHRGRPQRSGLGDGKLAAIRCYEIFLAFPKVQHRRRNRRLPPLTQPGNNFRSCLKRNHATAVRSPGSPMTQ